MKKAVALPYIIALVLGVTVIGILGYWFLTTSSGGEKSVSYEFCRAKAMKYCSLWSRCDFDPDPVTGCRPQNKVFTGNCLYWSGAGDEAIVSNSYAPECCVFWSDEFNLNGGNCGRFYGI